MRHGPPIGPCLIWPAASHVICSFGAPTRSRAARDIDIFLAPSPKMNPNPFPGGRPASIICSPCSLMLGAKVFWESTKNTDEAMHLSQFERSKLFEHREMEIFIVALFLRPHANVTCWNVCSMTKNSPLKQTVVGMDPQACARVSRLRATPSATV